MTGYSDIPLSVLDLSPIRAGRPAAEALGNTVALARATEAYGYHRFWISEHHNTPAMASSATSIIIGQVAASTERIRVGAGGVMLPNHAPYVVAEQFGTLATHHPGRIDLGLGRAPGTDPWTTRALRREHRSGADFPEQTAELRGYLAPGGTERKVRAIPGEGVDLPVHILGSSTFGAALAAREGLPFVFASHFAPDQLRTAPALYRTAFRPSATLAKPYAIVAPSALAAGTLVHTPAGRVPAVTPRALTDTGTRELIDGFVRSARRAVAAGLDGVEIHAAHGYLLHQFLAENANHRTDRWGGNTEGRVRLTVAITRAVADTIGPHRVGVRVSRCHPSGDLAETDPYGTCTALVRALAPFRIAYLHHGETGTELDTAVRELWPTALMVTPLPAGRDKPGAAARSLERGADLVSFGRDFLANPDLVTRCRAGAPLNEARPTGFHGGGAEGYTDYPALGDRPVPGP
ncbi:MsnO8 family LLM class oxidoreductase [Streptomyces sp. NPDC001985]|uniref:MsnO8 family LLM class oxidoreductase n=1 Tax=Streptomyces sp. NPDC001985 TaxID=3154406 RepID=UPI00331B98D5